MAPQASFLILNPSTMRKVHLTENYLVVGDSAETTVSGEFNVLDLRCKHKGLDMCEHRRRLPAGYAWDFDCCGDMMAVGNEDWKVRVWDLKTGTKRLVLTGHTDIIKCILFPDSMTIISGASDGGLIVWDVPSGTRRYTLDKPDVTGESRAITSLKFHDNLLVSAKSGGTVRIWDLNSGQSIHVLEANTSYVHVLEFNADHSLLATGASGGEIKIWNVKSGACIATCHGHTWVPTQFSTHPEDTGLLVSSSADGWIRTWKWYTGAPVRTLFAGDASAQRNAIRGFVWTKDLMVTGAVNGLLRAWDRQTNQARFDLRERQGSVYQFAAKGNLIAVAIWLKSRTHLIELYDTQALDQEQGRFMNKNEDLSGASLVMNLTFRDIATGRLEDDNKRVSD